MDSPNRITKKRKTGMNTSIATAISNDTTSNNELYSNINSLLPELEKLNRMI